MAFIVMFKIKEALAQNLLDDYTYFDLAAGNVVFRGDNNTAMFV